MKLSSERMEVLVHPRADPKALPQPLPPPKRAAGMRVALQISVWGVVTVAASVVASSLSEASEVPTALMAETR